MHLQISSTTLSLARTHVRLAGELDLASAVEARMVLLPLLIPDAVVELDLSGLRFMDSAGARLLTWAGRVAADHGATVVLTALSRPARRLLTVAGAEGSVRQVCHWAAADGTPTG